MTLPSTGQITAAMINVELGKPADAPFSLNDADARALAGKPTGTISYNDFYGKSSNTLDPYNKYIIMSFNMEPVNGNMTNIVDSSIYGNPMDRFGTTATLSATDPKFEKHCLYFPDERSYYYTPVNARIITERDFTIEVWVKPTKYNLGQNAYITSHATDNTWHEPSCYISNVDRKLILRAGAADRISSTAAIPLNQWTHVSYGRNNGKWFLYVNGILQGTYVNDARWNAWSLTLGAAGWARTTDASTPGKYVGYMDEFRWWKGASVRDGATNFTPPVSAWVKPDNSYPYDIGYFDDYVHAHHRFDNIDKPNTFIDNSNFKTTVLRNGNAKQSMRKP